MKLLSLSLLSLKWVINSVIVKDNISNKSWRIIQSIQYPFQSIPFRPSNSTHSASCDYPIQWCTNSICSLYLLHRPLSNPFHHPSPPALLPRLNEPLKILVALSCFPKYHLQRTSQKIQNLNI